MQKKKLLTAIILFSFVSSLLAGCNSQHNTKVIEKDVEVNYSSSPEQILSSYTEEGMEQIKINYPTQVFREYALKEIGKNAPDFELKNLKGENIKFSDLKGKKIVIDFEKTTSDVSKKSTPFLDKVSKEFSDIIYLTVFPMDTKDDIEKYYSDLSLDINKNVIAGKDNGDKMNLVKDYSLTSVPTLIFVDENGKISYTSIGNFDENTLISYQNVAFADTKLYNMVKKKKIEVDENGNEIKDITPDNSITKDSSIGDISDNISTDNSDVENAVK